MNPTLEEKQNDQAQEKQPGGGISRGINSINNLGRLKNPFGKIGSRVIAQTALRGFTAFLAGQGFPIMVALGLVLLFTIIIIMGFGGAPPSEMNNQTTNVAPTETITPTATLVPAEP